MKKKIAPIITIALIILVAFLIYMVAKNPAKPGEHFEIVLLKYGGEIPDIGSPKVQRMTVEKEKFIDENDIEFYEWNTQEITITKQASKRILNKFGEDLNKLYYWKGMQPIHTTDFEVLIGDKKLYDGTIRGYGDYPVIIPEISKSLLGNQIKLKIWGANDQESTQLLVVYNEKRKRIEIPEIKEFFKKLGKLRE